MSAQEENETTTIKVKQKSRTGRIQFGVLWQRKRSARFGLNVNRLNHAMDMIPYRRRRKIQMNFR